MLSELNINNSIEVSYASGAPPFLNQVFNFEDKGSKNLSWIYSVTTAGASIILASFFIRDEFGATVYQVGVIPWQFAGTTIAAITPQTPSPPLVTLFANQNIGGFIPADLRIFDGWSIQFGALGQDALTNTNAIIGLTD